MFVDNVSEMYGFNCLLVVEEIYILLKRFVSLHLNDMNENYNT